MRFGIVILFQLIFAAVKVWGDETLPVLKTASDVYSNVTVMTVTATDVYFTYDHGMANVKLRDLDPVFQKHFKYDSAKAAAAETKQKAGNTLFQSGLAESVAEEAKQKAANLLNARPDFVNLDEVRSNMDDAIRRVQAIVNQPVQQLDRPANMQVSMYGPGWFHPGAIMPDFDTVDVRSTQQCDYDKYPYVSSDLNPGKMFIGKELEFNPMTKYFYTDRSVPKKKLTEAEMLEINRLYRIIGNCEKQLAQQ
jgi:hypothetical protein